MIEFKHISKYFGKLAVLKDISLYLPAGQTIALIGPNGSGKTTLIKSLLGLVIPDKGDILMNGYSIMGQWKYRSNIGIQEPFNRDITISFKVSGMYWQVNNVSKNFRDTIFVSILHKPQEWCSHCSYYNGNYMIEVESKVEAFLVDRVMNKSILIRKNESIDYQYSVLDDSEQNNRFVMLVK